MVYEKFPRPRPWLEFESVYDFENYRNGNASWPNHLSENLKKFRTLLDDRPAEPAIHRFFEDHAYFLPGLSDLHHGPHEGIIATKLPLGQSFITDFAYVASNSQSLYFTCVEIESARKHLFRKDGKLHRDYLDGRQQITDWLFWAKQHPRDAIDCWGKLFNGRPAEWYDITFRGFLVFGRRSEIDTRVKQERWSSEAASLAAGLHTMTYDRLLQCQEWVSSDVENDKLVVCSYRDRRFYVKKVIG